MENLSAEQLKDYNDLISQGYTVSIDTDGKYTFINGYKSPFNSTSGIGTRAVIGSIKVSNKIYYGYTGMGTLSGSISVSKLSSTSISITGYSLSLNAPGSYGNSGSYAPKTGNPAILNYFFNIDTGRSIGTHGIVPFYTGYRVYPNGSVTFFNDKSMYD
ncbi:hypothetical protein AB3U99_21825 [Niallia sp. JL1B1071]|uniref:hypothetical protein n=1 Tax=Niallia tiangongensis TaxID=3237105 RepID=UPI0037DD84A5